VPSPYRPRIWLDWVYSRHAGPPQSPQTCVGLTPPTEELLLQHQPHWSCQRVRLSNDSIDQTPFGTLPCKSGNRASCVSAWAGYEWKVRRGELGVLEGARLASRLRIKPILLAAMGLANAAQASVKRNTSETSWVSSLTLPPTKLDWPIVTVVMSQIRFQHALRTAGFGRQRDEELFARLDADRLRRIGKHRRMRHDPQTQQEC